MHRAPAAQTPSFTGARCSTPRAGHHAPLDLTIDPVKATEATERTRIALLGKEVDIKGTRRRVNSMFR
jgi:hypothetical protein